MADQKEVRFFQEVLSKTKDERIPWEPTATDEDFTAAVGGEFTLLISQYETRGAYGVVETQYTLALKDDYGRVLSKVGSEDSNISIVEIQSLFEAARRQALRVDEKIGRAIEGIHRL